MRATFARVRSDEEAKRGLVIIKALYGRLVNITDVSTSGAGEGGISTEPEYLDEVIDVMIPLQCLVKDSKLVLHEASKVCCVKIKESCSSTD
jgi:DnaJ family protein C protein 11